MTMAVAFMTTFAASAQFMVVTTVNTPDSDLNEEWGTTNFTDNMGIGYILAVRPSFADSVVRQLQRDGESARVIGELRPGTGAVTMEGLS